jgi:hypothetical protein
VYTILNGRTVVRSDEVLYRKNKKATVAKVATATIHSTTRYLVCRHPSLEVIDIFSLTHAYELLLTDPNIPTNVAVVQRAVRSNAHADGGTAHPLERRTECGFLRAISRVALKPCDDGETKAF